MEPSGAVSTAGTNVSAWGRSAAPVSASTPRISRCARWSRSGLMPLATISASAASDQAPTAARRRPYRSRRSARSASAVAVADTRWVSAAPSSSTSSAARALRSRQRAGPMSSATAARVIGSGKTRVTVPRCSRRRSTPAVCAASSAAVGSASPASAAAWVRVHSGPRTAAASTRARVSAGQRSSVRRTAPARSCGAGNRACQCCHWSRGISSSNCRTGRGGAVGVLEQPPRGPRRQVHPDAGEGELGDVLRPERSHVHGDGTVMVEHLPGAVRDRVRQRVHDHQQDEQLPAVRPADGRRQGLQGLGIGPVGVVDDEDGRIVHQGQQLVRHLHRITSGGGGLQQLLDGAPRAPRLPRDTRGRAHLPVVEQLGESLHQSGLADTRRTLDEGEHG